MLRDLVLTIHWDHDPEPAIQVPLGDFFGNGFATRAELTSAAMVVAPSGGMNCYLPMPFRRHATVSITSDHPGEIPCVFFQIDYTLGDDLGADVGLLHAQWRRRTPATPPARITSSSMESTARAATSGPSSPSPPWNASGTAKAR